MRKLIKNLVVVFGFAAGCWFLGFGFMGRWS
jgi:hypothetical protein